MNQAIANIIRTHISGLDFIDKIAGLVAPLTFEIKDKDNNLVQKTFPIACCVSPDDCKEGAYNDLMPNSAYKTVIYFEDKGVTFNKSESNWKYYTSSLRLVCWINIEKLTESGFCKSENPCTYAAHIIAEIIRALPSFPGHYHPFDFVYSEVQSQEIRNPSIFASYTYDEKHSQYLMAPYDYFALDIQTTFAICMKNTDVYDAKCGAYDSINVPVATEATNIISSGFYANWNTVPDADGYWLEISTDIDFTAPTGHRNSDPLLLYFIASGLLSGTTYYYRVKAYKGTWDNMTVESEWSNIITVTTIQTIFDDYFMPAKFELKAMYDELKVYNVGGFTNNSYISSSEVDNVNVMGYDFLTGNFFTPNKNDILYVHACRIFTSTTIYALRDIGPAGGLIFHIINNGGGSYTYFETASTNQGVSVWSNVNNIAIGTTGTAIGDGQANTLAIIGQIGHINSAAKLCNDLIINNP